MKAAAIIIGLLSILTKSLEASENNTFSEQLNVGGFSSSAITLHRNAEAEAAINELSLLISWNNLGRLSFLSESTKMQ